MSPDLAAILRRRKPERQTRQRRPRDPSHIVDVDTFAAQGWPLAYVADTTVLIHAAAGRLPAAAVSLLERGVQFYCTVCLSELAAGLANRDVAKPAWRQARAYFVSLFDAIPANRLLSPDASVWIDAGLIAGALARTQGHARERRAAFLNDGLILLTAAKAGLPVLTTNRDDFDLIQQCAPEGRFVVYEAT